MAVNRMSGRSAVASHHHCLDRPLRSFYAHSTPSTACRQAACPAFVHTYGPLQQADRMAPVQSDRQKLKTYGERLAERTTVSERSLLQSWLGAPSPLPCFWFDL